MRGLKHVLVMVLLEGEVSHLLQMRGLKQQEKFEDVEYIDVASFTDAWIETAKKTDMMKKKESHLLQMRGLKLSPFVFKN